MKFFSIILSIYLLTSVVIPCTQQLASSGEETISCCSEQSGETGNDVPDDQHSDKDCSGCNPLASCHCCSIFVSFTQPMNLAAPAKVALKNGAYSEFLPSSLISQIWQPPKIS